MAAPARHPSAPDLGLSQQLLTGNPGPRDTTCGYGPIHRLAVSWDSPTNNGVRYWRAACGATGHTTARFGILAHALPAELCPAGECFVAISTYRRSA